MSRATARVAAMQLIFEKLSGGQGGDESLQMVYDELREEGLSAVAESDPGRSDRKWIAEVLSGVLEHLDELDGKIAAHSRNWTVERMPKVDLTILRLAVWELLYEENTPGSVVINEAVNLANTYSDDGSGRFINGVLGAILREKEAEA
ncbi:MAG: transcription antitermination factor NusB [Clostridia bacterium]|nr:transcription antitermination factor NusB [Clostridia bacterium]